MDTAGPRWGQNGQPGAQKPILIDLGGSPCEKGRRFWRSKWHFFVVFRPLAIFGGSLKPFRFFETASEDPSGPKKCVFERLGPLFVECSLAAVKHTIPRFRGPCFANPIFETGFWGPPVDQNCVFRGLRKRPSNDILQKLFFVSFFSFFRGMHSYLGNTYIGAPQGPPEADFRFLKRSSGGPWPPQGPKREAPAAPRNRDKGPDGRPRGPKTPPRAPLEPKGPFWRHAFLPRKNVHRAPRDPKSDLIFFCERHFGEPKTPKCRFRAVPSEPLSRLRDPFGACGALWGAEMGNFGGSVDPLFSSAVLALKTGDGVRWGTMEYDGPASPGSL